MELIEELMAELVSMPDLTWVWGILFFVGFGLGIGGLGINVLLETKSGQVEHGLHICYMGFAVIGICALVVVPHGWEIQDLRTEIKSAHIDLVINEMTCDEIRLEIVSVIERKNDPKLQPFDYQMANLEWEKEYYDNRCELPLRDEVLKLQ